MARSIRAMLTVKFAADRDHRLLVDRIMRQPSILAGRCVAGDIDMILDAECDTISELDDLRTRLLNVPGVSHVATHTMLQQHRLRQRRQAAKAQLRGVAGNWWEGLEPADRRCEAVVEGFGAADLRGRPKAALQSTPAMLRRGRSSGHSLQSRDQGLAEVLQCG